MRNTSTKTNSSRRPKPLVAKAGITRNRNRRYACGGKLK